MSCTHAKQGTDSVAKGKPLITLVLKNMNMLAASHNLDAVVSLPVQEPSCGDCTARSCRSEQE